jgi:hypothetical protein
VDFVGFITRIYHDARSSECQKLHIFSRSDGPTTEVHTQYIINTDSIELKSMVLYPEKCNICTKFYEQ